MLPGLELATQLIMRLCGGTPTEVLVAGTVPEPKTSIVFPLSEVKRLAGISPTATEAQRILEALGFKTTKRRGVTGLFSVKVPSWRPDVTMKADLVEEVVRIIGVDTVPPTPHAASRRAWRSRC